jgi:N-methylhydantoinase A
VFLHGTTVATNALLEGRGAKTALITTAGFDDLIEIGRQTRPSLYDNKIDRPRPLVERPSRHGYRDPDSLRQFLDDVKPESLAIGLLDADRDSAGEEEIERAVASWSTTVPVSRSSVVNPEFREFERIATTVVNAYLRPTVGSYLLDLERRLKTRALVMRSSGGLTSTSKAAELAASLLLSGPAGGVVAAAACGTAHGWKRVISFDMGGTSTDVCRIENGEPQVGGGRTVGGYVCRFPSVAVHTIGAGGGSIGWVDEGGALRVGPQSAGAWPGPAAYGRGGEVATVTDANLVLGRLGNALAGDTQLDRTAAEAALARVGSSLGLAPLKVAAGMVEIVNTHMEGAIRRVTVEEGADPREAALLAFGGAGGLHATAIARSLGMAAVLVPPHAGVFSALGLLLSPLRHDLSQSIVGMPLASLDDVVVNLEKRARREMKTEIGTEASEIQVSVEARYRGQSHETTVGYRVGSGRLQTDFEVAHEARNGFKSPGVEIEVVTVRIAALAPPALAWGEIGGTLKPGLEMSGPAIIEGANATTFLDEGERMVVLDDGTMEITW